METETNNVIQKLDTTLNADSVEWCPYPGFEHILLCGTYKLQEQAASNEESAEEVNHVEQMRVGGVNVYSLVSQDSCQQRLEERARLDMSGVLDIKWPDKMVDDKALFGLVNAEGYCQLFSVDESFAVEEVAKAKLTNPSLGLSLGFSSEHENGTQQVSASDSAGFITILDVGSDLRPILSWHAHDYEAWITAIHKFDSNLVFSGGDDCRLKGWDIRDNSRPVFVSKRHQMGVCSVQSHPFKENVFASGSYDEEVLVWDRRVMKTPLKTASLGGGVWRIKWNPFDGLHILTATMYNGTHIIDCSDTEAETMPIVAHHGGHNLAYGADWCRLNSVGKRLQCDDSTTEPDTHRCDDKVKPSYLIATCSFYDQSLHLWEWSHVIK